MQAVGRNKPSFPGLTNLGALSRTLREAKERQSSSRQGRNGRKGWSVSSKACHCDLGVLRVRTPVPFAPYVANFQNYWPRKITRITERLSLRSLCSFVATTSPNGASRPSRTWR